GRLLTLLPKVPTRESYLSPSLAVDSIASLVGKHLDACQALLQRKEGLQSELGQLQRYLVFLGAIEMLAPKGPAAADREFIGIQAKDPMALDQLAKVADRILPGTVVTSAKMEDGSYIGLLTTEKQLAHKLREGLRGNQIPEITLPSYLDRLPLPDKVKAAQARHDELSAQVASIDNELIDMARKWRAIYQPVQSWIEQRLSLLRTSASLYETDRCFVLFGWIPSAAVAGLRQVLAEHHGDAVVVEEREILKQDLETVPVVLRNPAYLQPFELLVRLLPLPRYTSIDPTPFLAIFFPLFFGMILGDIGYGFVLLLAALSAILFAKRRKIVRQAGEILLVSSIYTIVFGVLYGECFGELGTRLFGLKPFVDRQTSLLPMVYFALAVGSVHVVVGLVLGVVSALKGRQTKEAVFRALSILVVICVAGILASYFAPVAALMRGPLITVVLIMIPILIFTGGFLAPFELLRDFGNIISYVRLMAVGLASVLLASIANRLAGAAGSVWIGVAVAILLHAFNILLGVFAPTVHALRLQYVEFFSKFMETGGKDFKPLKTNFNPLMKEKYRANGHES
ncbi:MAG TPA: V-type ATPase 116kDa subunit family protein, partial [Steroidobacteraceae bacterium]|nr:V-type ATPase 116kDa subunit family protein [Steroidobacteraceae bacterium]